MPSIFLENIDTSVVPALLIACLIIEMILSGTWNRMYFTMGLPIFVMRVPVDLRHSNIPPSSQLEEHLPSALLSSLVFREVEVNTYGFRENFFEFGWRFRYPSLMHGMLFFDFNNNQVVVKGLVNWFWACFSLIWVSGALLQYEPMIALIFIFVYTLGMALLYSLQHERFSRVTRLAAEAWSRKYPKTAG